MVFILRNPAGRCFIGHTEDLEKFVTTADADVAAYLAGIDSRGFAELLRRRKALEALEAKANIQLQLVGKGA